MTEPLNQQELNEQEGRELAEQFIAWREKNKKEAAAAELAVQQTPTGTPLPQPSDAVQPSPESLLKAAIHAANPSVVDLKGVENAAPKLAALRTLNSKKLALKEELASIEAQEAEIIGDIQDLVGGDDTSVEDIRYGGKPFATWKVTRQRRLNQKRLRETVGPDIYETLKDEIVFRSFKVLQPEEE
jgi:hypothetical protein